MNKANKISTKIKLIGALLIVMMLSVITTTIYLSKQNSKDALVVNIVGKQRMLTQQISKNIFYIHYSSNKDFYELNKATDEFLNGLNILKYGDSSKEISPVTTQIIVTQLNIVNKLWNNFYNDIQNFKIYNGSNNPLEYEKSQEIVTNIYKNNIILLNSVDKLVSQYTEYSESKTEYLKTFQYGAAIIFILLFIYSLQQLRIIESHVDEFMDYSKQLLNGENNNKIMPLKVEEETESEIIEVSDTINCFISKINSAMDYSNEALLQSEQASQKLEELTDEFDTIIDEIQDKTLVQEHLNNSEDIVIESSEELLNSTKKLQNLKLELQKLTESCKTQ
ncbi:MAG: type IV pili methyl-accepting chemotaxis transducer N-terminal domain-containing protein [Campylobacterota bacterium]|nr:type IV pili methyl-accepting chemotaxis transducer N-terminal domain-containing protein [Campylobacterota bacterium]